jgi:dihydroorotase
VSSLILRGGRVVDPASDVDGLYDVIVIDGKIDSLQPTGKIALRAGERVLDCAGVWVVPGLIDPHVHLRDPGFPEKENVASGLAAAVAGGFTTVAAMANTAPVNDSIEITHYMLERARKAGTAQLAPVSAVSKGLQGRELVDFDGMIQAGVRMFSDDGMPIDDEAVLISAFNEASRTGFAISLHEEDRTLTADGALNAGQVARELGAAGIPATAETLRVCRDLAVAIRSGAPVHIAHVSTAGSVELIRAAKRHAPNLTCEVTPHHFTLDDHAVLTRGPNAIMAPPLRSRADVDALLEGMADGTIDMIATDHAPHDPVSKRMDQFGHLFGPGKPIPRLSANEAATLAHAAKGVVGLETAVGLALSLVHRGIISLARMVEMMAVKPAQLLRLTQYGCLAVGATANITIIDPELEWTVEPSTFASKSHNTPFAGMKLTGLPVATIVRGEIMFDRRKGALVQ